METLSAQVEELEQENNHLSNEHLAMLKKQENIIGKKGGDTSDQSTLDETNQKSISDDMTQITAVKDKQIDLLSSMLAQKEVDMKNIKLENEAQIKELSVKLGKNMN